MKTILEIIVNILTIAGNIGMLWVIIGIPIGIICSILYFFTQDPLKKTKLRKWIIFGFASILFWMISSFLWIIVIGLAKLMGIPSLMGIPINSMPTTRK